MQSAWRRTRVRAEREEEERPVNSIRAADFKLRPRGAGEGNLISKTLYGAVRMFAVNRQISQALLVDHILRHLGGQAAGVYFPRRAN